MAETVRRAAPPLRTSPLRRIDGVLAAIAALVAAMALADPGGVKATIGAAAGAFAATLPVLVAATLALAWVRAAGAEALVGRAFRGREGWMIVMAAAAGALAPFCSCQVIPFVAALLAMGAPLSAVMAFWLASPLMDPAMFLFTAGVLGTGFAVAKTVAAVAIGVGGGAAVRALAGRGLLAEPLRARSPATGCCSRPRTAFPGTAVWAFWREPARVATFGATAAQNLWFLGRWLALAYLVEAAMLAHLPAGAIAGWLGGDGALTVVAAAAAGVPAYLNGYAAVPLVAVAQAVMAQSRRPVLFLRE